MKQRKSNPSASTVNQNSRRFPVSGLAQRKGLVSPLRQPPVTLPVYSPQPAPRVLQAKEWLGVGQPEVMGPAQRIHNHSKKAPAAPPAYRPQPPPKVLQRKAVGSQQLKTDRSIRQPLAPPVYKPKTTNVVSPKLAEALQAFVPRKATTINSLTGTLKPHPSAWKFPGGVQTIQRASSSNSSESCAVKLKIGNNWFDGSTGKDHGHAEMDALHNFVNGCDGIEDAVKKFDKARYKVVGCPGKEVCLRCGAVLQTLEFNTGENTRVGDQKNGERAVGC